MTTSAKAAEPHWTGYLTVILSLCTLGFLAHDKFLEQPKIKAFWPSRVALYRYDNQNGIRLIRVGAKMSYFNEAWSGHGGAVIKEVIYLRVGSHRMVEYWNNFGELERNQNKQIQPRYTDDAAPVAIEGQSAVSHTTFFMPQVHCVADGNSCDESTSVVTSRYFGAQLSNQRVFWLDFRSEIFPHHELDFTCKVKIGDAELLQWKEHGDMMVDCG